jgi:uncharacterized membrane protein
MIPVALPPAIALEHCKGASMTDETRKTDAPAEEPVDVAVGAVVDDAGVEAEGAIAVQGTHVLIVAQFADMDSASIAYEALREAEWKRAIDIEGVLVADADYQGKITIRKMTDHRTRNGTFWGAIAGGALAIVFPPSILAGLVIGGVAGAVAGKVGNQLKEGAVAKNLADVITPGTSGIIALVNITAVDAVKASMPAATKVETAPVDDVTAATITAAAKEAGDTTPA